VPGNIVATDNERIGIIINGVRWTSGRAQQATFCYTDRRCTSGDLLNMTCVCRHLPATVRRYYGGRKRRFSMAAASMAAVIRALSIRVYGRAGAITGMTSTYNRQQYLL